MTQTYSSRSQEMFIRADEVREIMGISRAYAYKIIKQLNDELEAKGFFIVNGRTSRKYFNERFYGKAC